MKAEVFILLLVFVIALVWAFWYRITNRLYSKGLSIFGLKLFEGYNPENDNGLKAEERRIWAIATAGRKSKVATGAVNQDAPGRDMVQTTSPDTPEQNGNSPRGFFKRFRRG